MSEAGPSRDSVRVRSWHLVLAAAANTIAAQPAVALFADSGDLLPVLACTSLIGVVPGWLAMARGWSARRTLLAGLGAAALILAGLSGVAAVSGSHGEALAAFQTVAAGWLYGPANLLTANPPLDTAAPDMAFVVSAVLLTAEIAALLAARAGSTVTPLLPMVALFASGISITAGTPATHQTDTVLFVMAAFVFVIVRAAATVTAATSDAGMGRSMLRHVGRRGALPLTVLATLLLLSGIFRPFTDDGGRANPRSLVHQELDIQTRISPLSKVKVQLTTWPPKPLFQIAQVGRGGLGDRIRTAALESYNGITWTTALPFAAAGHHFFPEPGVAGARTVTARVTIGELDGVFLPTAGYPVRLANVTPRDRRLGFSRSSGVIVDIDQVRPRFTYEITGRIRERDTALALVQQPTHVPPELLPYVVLPTDIPAELRSLSGRFSGTDGSALAKLTAIETYLRALPYRVEVPAGHSYASILGLVGTADTPSVGGFAEQRAAAFAVLARLAGVPTRIAVGYRLTGDQNRPVQVTTLQAHAWPESYFPGYGWIAFEPTDHNQQAQPRQPPPVGPSPQPPPSSPRPSLAVQAQPPLSRPPVAPAQASDHHSWDPPLWLLALPAAAAVALVGQKQRRRWSRRHTNQPADRVRGAWREAMDRLLEHGFRERASDTPQETVERARHAFNAANGPLGALAPLVTAAAFSNNPPSDDEINQAWRHERELRRTLHRGLTGMLRAVRAFADPRPLWRLTVRNRHTNGDRGR